MPLLPATEDRRREEEPLRPDRRITLLAGARQIGCVGVADCEGAEDGVNVDV